MVGHSEAIVLRQFGICLVFNFQVFVYAYHSYATVWLVEYVRSVDRKFFFYLFFMLVSRLVSSGYNTGTY